VTIFILFLRARNVSMDMQGRNVLFFVDSCATYRKEMLFIRNIEVVCYPTNCTNMLQPLDLGMMRHFKQLYRMHVVQAGLVLCQGYIPVKHHAN